MICDKYKTIFVHIPKTGGTSIEKVFFNDLKFKDFGLDSKENLFYQHFTPSELLAKGFIDQTQHDNYYKFTFVRNPWDRMVSEYFFQIKNVPILRRLSFTDFIYETKKVLNGQKSLLDDAWGINKHLEPQINFIKNEKIDFIGRFESLERDFVKICKTINHPVTQLKKENSTEHFHYSHYYDTKTMRLVEDLYREDIEYFGYNFNHSLLSDIEYLGRSLLKLTYKASCWCRQNIPGYKHLINFIKNEQ